MSERSERIIENGRSAVAGTTAIVTITNVSKRWDDSSGLEPVSFEISPGQVVVVKGRSGSGKSTLLAILAGWCTHDTGDVIRHGEWGIGRIWQQWRHTAIVPQVLGNVPELSARENLDLPLRLGGSRRGVIDPIVGDMLDALDLVDEADRRPGEISVGQQQRLAVARALIISPTLLLADEPTSHQDSRHAAAVIEALRAGAGRGSAVLVASHEPAVVETADTVITLDA